MDWITIGLALLTFGALAVFVARPWWAQRRQPQPETTLDTSLAQQREETLNALRDLEFDYEVGKIIEEDYILLRQSLLADTAVIMTQIEQEQAHLNAPIEAEIFTTRKDDSARQVLLPPAENAGACPICNRIPLAGDLYCRGCGTHLAPACPECGKIISPTDRFCVACGLELALAVAG